MLSIFRNIRSNTILVFTFFNILVYSQETNESNLDWFDSNISNYQLELVVNPSYLLAKNYSKPLGFANSHLPINIKYKFPYVISLGIEYIQGFNNGNVGSSGGSYTPYGSSTLSYSLGALVDVSILDKKWFELIFSVGPSFGYWRFYAEQKIEYWHYYNGVQLWGDPAEVIDLSYSRKLLSSQNFFSINYQLISKFNANDKISINFHLKMMQLNYTPEHTPYYYRYEISANTTVTNPKPLEDYKNERLKSSYFLLGIGFSYHFIKRDLSQFKIR